MKKRLRDALSGVLPPEELTKVHNSYDIVGDIAIMRLCEISPSYRLNVAETLMCIHRNVKTVLMETGPVHGDFRIRKLEHIAGEKRTTAIHMESGCRFLVDVEKCYFSPRLSHERMRIANQVRPGEVVVNMFAGAGCFSLLIAKHASPSKVYSIDINPFAVQFMRENVRTNGAYGRVLPILGDAKEVIEKELHNKADRVLMPLPEKALEYLPYALSSLTKSGGWIHYYDFEHAAKEENSVENAKLKVAKRLESLEADFEIPFGRVVRSTGPNWYQVVLDIKARI